MQFVDLDLIVGKRVGVVNIHAVPLAIYAVSDLLGFYNDPIAQLRLGLASFSVGRLIPFTDLQARYLVVRERQRRIGAVECEWNRRACLGGALENWGLMEKALS